MRRTGEPADLLLIYEKHRDRCFGVVVADGSNFPLITDESTGSLCSHGTFQGATVRAQPAGAPRVVIFVRRQGGPGEIAFAWNGSGFDALH